MTLTAPHQCTCYICRANRALDALTARADLTETDRAALAELAAYIEETVEDGFARTTDILCIANALRISADGITMIGPSDEMLRRYHADALTEMLARAVAARNAAYTERGYHTARDWCNNDDGLAVVGDVLTYDIMELIGDEAFAAVWEQLPDRGENNQ